MPRICGRARGLKRSADTRSLRSGLTHGCYMHEALGPGAGRAHVLLAAWDIGAVREIRPAAGGTINSTLLITSAAGQFVLRCYRHTGRLPVEREHAAIAYAAARGVPAVAALELRVGGTVYEHDRCFYALFPYARGSQYAKAGLTTALAAGMGASLAGLHRALNDYPAEQANRRVFVLDAAAALAQIDRIEEALRRRPRPTDADRAVLARLAGRRAAILRDPVGSVDLKGMPEQLIHGDFQETNLFFEGGQVSAVIDWDQTYLAPPAFEVSRTLHIAFQFAPELCRAFLSAYRAVADLPAALLEHAAAFYCRMRLYDLWMEQAYYCEHNQRVGRFLHAEGPVFVPLIERWRGLAAPAGSL